MKLFRSLLIVCILTLAAGCEKTETQPQEPTAPAEGRIEELSAELEHLRNENRELAARNQELARYVKDSGSRIRQLISGYGPGIWDYGENDDYPVFMKALPGAGIDGVLAELNQRFRSEGQPELRFVRKDGRTVFLAVADEEQLGERMGSHGALAYMEAVAYSVTSIPGVECVYFDIGESEHAAPGRYCEPGGRPFLPQ